MVVLACMTEEMKNWEIPTALDLSESTVKAHGSDLPAKLGAVDRSGVILDATQWCLRRQGS
jgi:DNA-binding NarL/FixJ family response regulator